MGAEISDPAWIRERLLLHLPAYLRLHSGLDVQELELGPLERPRGGESNETVLFETAWRADGQPQQRGLVLRLQPGQNRMFRDADVVAEGELLCDLRMVSAVPVPEVLVVEQDCEALGRPFFLMFRVAGHVPAGRPSIHRDPWLVSRSPGDRRQVLVNGMVALAQVHATDWTKLRRFIGGAPGLDKEFEQLELWYAWASKGANYPLIVAGISHLQANRP